MEQTLSYDFGAVMDSAVATGTFVSICTIQKPIGSYTPSGAPVNSWINVTGLIAIPCISAPLMGLVGGFAATELKSTDNILAMTTKHVLLNAYYPTILSNWRALIDGVAHDILGIEHDSQKQMTRLQVRLANL